MKIESSKNALQKMKLTEICFILFSEVRVKSFEYMFIF